MWDGKHTSSTGSGCGTAISTTNQPYSKAAYFQYIGTSLQIKGGMKGKVLPVL
jgi:hypothetical protein